MKIKYLFLTVILSILGYIPLLQAQSQEQWWLHSSYESKPISDTLKSNVEKVLFHAESKYSLTLSNGITNGSVHAGDILLVERKNRFSHFSYFNINSQNLTIKSNTNSNYKQTVYEFVDYLDIDISKMFFSEIGLILDRNDAALIKSRNAFYLGLGANNLLFKKFHVKSLVAIGRVNQNYTIPVTTYNVIKEPYTLLHIGQKYTLPIDKNITLNGNLSYFIDTNEIDRYRIHLNFNIKAYIIKHIALVVSYSYKYDNEQVLLNLIPNNSLFTTGIQLSL
ncbi:MAG: DUF481 domain-containing protein [Prolixibacteraceae bacterium]|jgi:hypothetical protein|nr:DUF481 domain-containing protein [Prolixibacteraceae bacterium]